MDITSIFSTFDKYGWPGIAVVVLVILVYFLIKNYQKHTDKGLELMTSKIIDSSTAQNKSLVESLDKQNEKLIATLSTHNEKMFDYIINKQSGEHAKGIDNRLDIGSKIYNKIQEVGFKYHCNRVSVIEFHNSKENLSGMPFVWYDIQYEWHDLGVEPIGAKVKNAQSSTLTPVIEALKNDTSIIWYKADLDKLYQLNSVLYSYLVTTLNVTSIMYQGLYNDNHKLIGLLAIEYVNDDTDVDLLDVDDISLSGTYISSLITLK